jgi:hypothetical protein
MAEEALKITITADNKDALAKFQQTIKGLDGISVAGDNAGGATKKLGKDFTGISRVIQDLPYGFNAISNNLTQLVPAAGAAGLAFSALVAGLSFAQIGLSNWTRGSKDSNETTKEVSKNLTNFYTNLQEVKTAFDTARGGAMSKTKALEEYNDKLGATIGYATSLEEAEKLLAANTEKVIKALMLRTQAQVMYGEAAKNSAKIVSGELATFDVDGESFKELVKSFFTGANAADVFKRRTFEATDAVSRLNAEGNKLIQQAIGIEKGLAGSREKATGGGKGKTPVTDAKDLNKELEAQIAIYLRLRDARIKAQGQGALGTIMPERDKEKDLTNLKLTTDGNAALNQVLLRQSELQDQRNQNMAIANGLTDVAMNSLTGLVNAMANGQNIGQALGDMFKRLAVDIALAAAKAMIFQAILGALTGGGSAAAGGAAKGGGFLKMFGKMLGFSEGGTVSGPKSGYPVMLHGTEHIVRPDQMRSIIASASQMGGGNSRVIVEGRISGQDIWLSQQRTNTFRALTT